MSNRQRARKAIIMAAFLLFPVIIFYYSPYIIILGAAEGIVAASLIMFSAQFLLSFFLGRATCGYLCPVGGLQECLASVNGNKAKGGKRNLIKYCIWVPWIATIVALFIRAGGINRIDFFFHIKNGVSLNEPFSYAIYYGVVLLVAVLALACGKRAFCHYVCWMVPFMVIGSKAADILHLPKLRLVSNKRNCVSCGKCADKCPMSLDVRDMAASGKMENAECILCGECADVCPKKAIAYTYKSNTQ